jgi:uncharacterized membrane protein
MEPAARKRLIIIVMCIAVSVLLAMARGSVWKHQHDEGTTFDIAVGAVIRGYFIPPALKTPLPITAAYKTVDARTSYSLGNVVGSLSAPDYRMYHPPAYYMALHLWTKVFGTSRLVLRLPAYLLAALMILGMVRIARRVIPEAGAGVWMALLFGLSPWVLRLTNFARPYQLALFCAVWATASVLAMQTDRPRRSWRVLFVALSLLGIFTLYHYAFVFAWHLAWMAWHGWSARPAGRRPELLALCSMLALVLIGYAPWFNTLFVHLTGAAQSGDYFQGSVEPIRWYTHALQAFQDFTISDALQTRWGQHLGTLSLVLAVITLPVAVWAFAGPARRKLDACARRFWISAALLPVLLVASDIWRGNHTIFIPKLCFGLIVLLALIVVRAWMAVPVAWLRNAGLTSWALLMACSVTLTIYSEASIPSEMEQAAEAIAQADTAYHLVVISTDLRGYVVPFLLSLQDAGVSNVFIAQAAGHENLIDLMVNVSNNMSSRFQRVSLVNFRISMWPGKLMWDPEFVKNEIVVPARETEIWQAFWHTPQSWMGDDALITSDRPPDNQRELWMIGPVATRFYASPIRTEQPGDG